MRMCKLKRKTWKYLPIIGFIIGFTLGIIVLSLLQTNSDYLSWSELGISNNIQFSLPKVHNPNDLYLGI